MLHWLLQRYGSLIEQVGEVSTGDSRVFLTARTALAAATSFLVAWWCGPLAIRWLKRHFRERIDSASAKLNELHAGKQATPTMGGLFVATLLTLFFVPALYLFAFQKDRAPVEPEVAA